MPVEIAVTRASAHDAVPMAAIHRVCFAKPWDEAAIAQFLASPETLCLVGSIADSAGGTMGGFLIARRAADEAEILTFCVAPACRNAGLGRALLEIAATELRAAGAKQLFLEVEEGNEAALKLYRSLGAVPVGKRERYYESGADAAIFSLAL
ncbi:MAG TPA: GNAT family N-acetyltransferase [Methyloceanibacter sp.]|nr:GNAT family N-acetyltransferase [Methyloceanibacter sp.]